MNIKKKNGHFSMEKNDVPALKSFLSQAYQNIFDESPVLQGSMDPELDQPEQFGIEYFRWVHN